MVAIRILCSQTLPAPFNDFVPSVPPARRCLTHLVKDKIALAAANAVRPKDTADVNLHDHVAEATDIWLR